MHSRRTSFERLLAGLQVGILGALSLLGWFFLLSLWYFRAPWTMWNLFAASLRNSATFGPAFAWTTWTGVAAHLFVCGILGMLVGWILPEPHPSSRFSFSGLSFGFVVSLIVYEMFWRNYVPLLSEIVAPLFVFAAHLLYGFSISQFPRFYWKLAEPERREPLLLPAPDTPPTPAPPSAAAAPGQEDPSKAE